MDELESKVSENKEQAESINNIEEDVKDLNDKTDLIADFLANFDKQISELKDGITEIKEK